MSVILLYNIKEENEINFAIVKNTQSEYDK